MGPIVVVDDDAMIDRHTGQGTGVTRQMTNEPLNRCTRLLVLYLLCGTGLSCAGLERNPNVPGTYSDRLSPYNYKEEGRLAMMVVGVEAARFIRQESYFPVFVQLANKSKQTFIVSRESFTIEDSLGRRYGTAPPAEIAQSYPRQDLDRRLFRANRSVTSTYVGLFTLIPSNFFPSTSRRALRVEQVTVPPRAYLEDVLYFPIPDTGLNGVPLRLLFKDRVLAEPVQIVFEVPRTLGILEKEDAPAPREGGR